jgi:hypothetical protein
MNEEKETLTVTELGEGKSSEEISICLLPCLSSDLYKPPERGHKNYNLLISLF